MVSPDRAGLSWEGCLVLAAESDSFRSVLSSDSENLTCWKKSLGSVDAETGPAAGSLRWTSNPGRA